MIIEESSIGQERLALRSGLNLSTAFLVSHGGVKVRALTGAAGG